MVKSRKKLGGFVMINKDEKNEREFYDKIGSLIGWDFSMLKYE